MNKKLFLSFFVFLFLISFSYATLQSDLTSYYRFDEPSGNLRDFVNGCNATNSGVGYGAVGILNDSYLYVSAGSDHSLVQDVDCFDFENNAYSISVWVYVLGDGMVINRDNNANTGFYMQIAGASEPHELTYGTRAGGSSDYLTLNNVLYDSNWYHIVFTRNDTGDKKIYLNNVSLGNSNDGDLNVSYRTNNLAIGESALGTLALDGRIDELGFWDRELSLVEVQTLWNNSNGYNFNFDTIPSLTMNWNLINNTVNYNLATINITYNGSLTDSNSDLFNCSFFVDSVLNLSISDINLSNNNLINYSVPEIEADITFSLNCSNYENSADTGGYIYSIDRIEPSIFSDFVNNSNWTVGQTLTYYVNFTDTNLFAYNLSFILNNTVQENYFAENIIAMTIAENQTSRVLNQSGNFTIRNSVWDSHNPINKPVKDLSWWVNNNNIFVEDFIIEGDIKNNLTYFYLEDNKYKLKVTFNEDLYTHNLLLSANKGLFYVENSEYKGHFVYLPKNRYIDFEGNNIDSVIVDKEGELYNIEINLIEQSDEIEFESIGDLNFVENQYYYYVASTTTTTTISTNFTNIYVNTTGLENSIKQVSDSAVVFGLIFLIMLFIIVGVIMHEYLLWLISAVLCGMLSLQFFSLYVANQTNGFYKILAHGFYIIGFGIIAIAIVYTATEKRKNREKPTSFYIDY